MDPSEIRRINLIRADKYPYVTPTWVEYDSAEHGTALDMAMEMIEYKDFRQPRPHP